jgi:hypothetical protein
MSHHDVPPATHRPLPRRRRVPLALRWWFVCACLADRLEVAAARLRRDHHHG